MPKATNRGGKQPGVGRKPGGSQLARLAPPPLKPPRVGQIGADAELVRAIARSRARGTSWSALGRQYQRDDETIKHWLLDIHPDIYQQECIAYSAGPEELVAQYVPDAVDALGALVRQDQDASVRYRSASEILDRRFGKALVRTESDNRIAVSIEFRSSAEPTSVKTIEHGAATLFNRRSESTDAHSADDGSTAESQ